MANRVSGSNSRSRLDRAVIASVLAMAAMNLVVLSDLIVPAPTFAAATIAKAELA